MRGRSIVLLRDDVSAIREGHTIDEGVGTTQVALLNRPDHDLVLSADRAASEVALYELRGA